MPFCDHCGALTFDEDQELCTDCEEEAATELDRMCVCGGYKDEEDPVCPDCSGETDDLTSYE